MKTLLFAVTLAFLPAVTLAEDSPVLAVYNSDSGSVEPRYQWTTTVTIHEDGQIELEHCKNFEAATPTCRTRNGKAVPGGVEAIREATLASGLIDKPATPSEAVIVGGSAPSATVYIDGQPVEILSEPDFADRDRVNAVKAAIEAALPARFQRLVTG